MTPRKSTITKRPEVRGEDGTVIDSDGGTIFCMLQDGESPEDIAQKLDMPLQEVHQNIASGRPTVELTNLSPKLQQKTRRKREEAAIIREFKKSPNVTWAEIAEKAKTELSDSTLRTIVKKEGLWHLRKSKTDPRKKSARRPSKREPGDSGWEWVRTARGFKHVRTQSKR